MKNSFVVRFGVSLWLASLGISGWLATPLSFIATWLLGSFLDQGILAIDLTIDSIRIALEKDEYRELAKAAYDHASARVYTEEEKVAIRQQYQDALRRFGSVGDDSVSNQPSS